MLERSRDLGLLGPGPVAEHVRHTQGFLVALGEIGRQRRPDLAVDLGSGGGVPGLVLAAAPELAGLRWKLVDAMARRTSFLRWAVTELDLADRVTVVEGRAEVVAHDAAHRHQADVVVARSFGRPAVVAECATGLLRTGGHLLVSEPPGPGIDAARWPAAGLAELGLAVERLVRHGRSGAVVLRQERACSTRYPRRTGVPAKRPLF